MRQNKNIPFLFLILATTVGLFLTRESLPQAFIRLPQALTLPLIDWFNVSLLFLMEDIGLVKVTRGISAFIKEYINIIQNILLGGRKGLGLPALPWITVVAVVSQIAYILKGWRIALFVAFSFTFLAVFGQWKDAMNTLSLVLVAVPISTALGLVLGISAYKSAAVRVTLAPLLNIAQSLPHFSYLIPVVVFFGVGHQAGVIATVIFATPPMIRMTLLGLQKVAPQVIESGYMSGCSSRQLLFRVLLPSSKHDIMIGVNQVIMQCLAMVVIASFIGAPGLGYKLLLMLQNLRIGKAIELGIAIVLIAIILDRLSLAFANRKPDYRADLPFYTRYKHLIICAIIVLTTITIAQLLPFTYKMPRSLTITTEPFWNGIVDYIVVNWFESVQVFRRFVSIDILIPTRDIYLATPFIAVFILLLGISFLVGRLYSVLLVLFYIGFIALSGWWDRAMITAYMVSFSVFTCVVLGIPLGFWASRKTWRHKTVLTLCDTFQTFPSFIYLIPVIMVLQVNDVSAIAAVIIYGSIPAVRYTIEGLKNVPKPLLESATMSGANRWQRLMQVEFPMAFPHILIGINQTVMFSLFMVIIAAFIGTQDLGQEIMRALAESNMGKGLVLGLCVAFMGLIVDHLASTWAQERKRRLGLT